MLLGLCCARRPQLERLEQPRRRLRQPGQYVLLDLLQCGPQQRRHRLARLGRRLGAARRLEYLVQRRGSKQRRQRPEHAAQRGLLDVQRPREQLEHLYRVRGEG